MFPKKGQRESATDNSGCCAIYKQYVNSKNAVFLKRNTVFFMCAEHGTNLASESLATGIYRQV